MTDFIVIGAGVTGCSVANALIKQHQSVKLIDKSGIANSGSGAAGAFLSPMLGFSNPYLHLVNTAFDFAIPYYEQEFPAHIRRNALVRIAKSHEDFEHFESYGKNLTTPHRITQEYGGGMVIDYGSTVDSVGVCEAMVRGAEVIREEVASISHDGEYWYANQHRAKYLILTQGAYPGLIPEPYIHIKPIWGQRIVVSTTTQVPTNLHKNCSISKSIDGKLSIGATYVRGVIEQPCDEQNTKELIKKSKEILELENLEVVSAIGGARAATMDYFPISGAVIDSAKAIERYPKLSNGQNIPMEALSVYPNLFMLNGIGSRGFVLSPYLATNLVSNILHQTPLIENISTHRLFTRWVRKR